MYRSPFLPPVPAPSMMIYRPAGDSSDDSDDYEGFSFGDEFSANAPMHKDANRLTREHQLDMENEIVEVIRRGTPAELIEIQSRAPSFHPDISAGERQRIRPFRFDVNAMLCSNWPPIMYAAYESKFEHVAWLLSQNAMVNVQVRGHTPLIVACMLADRHEPDVLKVVQILLNNGAVLNVGGPNGQTPFMYALTHGYKSVVNLMLTDVALEATDNEGHTALYFAIAGKHYDLVEQLLKSGAKTNIINNDGMTPRMWAESNGFDAERLQEFFPELEPFEVPAQFLAVNSPAALAPTVFVKPDVPAFFYDVQNMLIGMNCTALVPAFVHSRVNLMQFLSMDNRQLERIGITFPFQRNRILYGLQRFHRKPFSPDVIRQFRPSDTMAELFSIIAGDLKMVLIANATLSYVLKNDFDETTSFNIFSDIKYALHDINEVTEKIRQHVATADGLTQKPPEYVDPMLNPEYGLAIVCLDAAITGLIAFAIGSFVFRKWMCK